MLLAEHPLAGLERAPEERLGLAIAALGIDRANARLFTLISVSGCSLPSTRSLASSARLIERLGLAVAALGLIQRRQIVHASKRIGMLLAEHPLVGLSAR